MQGRRSFTPAALCGAAKSRLPPSPRLKEKQVFWSQKQALCTSHLSWHCSLLSCCSCTSTFPPANQPLWSRRCPAKRAHLQLSAVTSEAVQKHYRTKEAFSRHPENKTPLLPTCPPHAAGRTMFLLSPCTWKPSSPSAPTSWGGCEADFCSTTHLSLEPKNGEDASEGQGSSGITHRDAARSLVPAARSPRPLQPAPDKFRLAGVWKAKCNVPESSPLSLRTVGMRNRAGGRELPPGRVLGRGDPAVPRPQPCWSFPPGAARSIWRFPHHRLI